LHSVSRVRLAERVRRPLRSKGSSALQEGSVHRSRWVTFFALLFAACVARPQFPPSHGIATPSLKLAKLPLAFEPIVDRFAESNTYLARSGRIQINFSSAGFQILPTSGDGLFSLDVRLAGANPKQQILAAEKTGGESNYLLGADPSMSSPSSPIGNEGERQPTLARPN
jgi:hypothetical protein